MNLEFFLPTQENWCGTYEGGYVKVYISNDKQPINITKDGCDWQNEIIINFSGNDDLMWRKIYPIEEKNKNNELLKALDMISKIPLPVTKSYLKNIGFNPD